MIKRITKITGLLMSAASVISIMPVQAADIQNVASQDGTVYSAKAKGNGIFIDGAVNGSDEAVYWMSDDGKYNKLAVDTGSSMTDELMNQYLEVDTGAKDLTYLDIKNGYQDVGYDAREDLESTVGRAAKEKLRHDDNGRFGKDELNSLDFTTLYNRESSIAPSAGKVRTGFVSTSDGLSVFQVPLKDKLEAGISNTISYYNDYSNANSKASVSNTSAIYADAAGNYVDADYSLGDLRIYEGTTTGASVILKNTNDTYDITKDGKTYQLKAVLQEKKYITEFSDTVERLANLTIYKKGPNDSSYSKVTTSDGFIFGGGKNLCTVDGTTTVVQAFSKTPASDNVDGIKYPKSSTIYFLADKDGKKGGLIADSLTNSKNDLTGVSTAANTYSTKLTGNDKFICSIYLDINNNKIYAESGTLSHKNSFNYLDISDSDESDIDSASSGINNAGGLPWFVNSGYIMTWDGDHSFKKVAKIDSGLTSISTGSSTKIIAYDPDKEVYGVINIPKAAATTAATGATTGTSTTAVTTGASVTVSTAQVGWTKNKDNTWCYLENGTKKTGWLKDGSAWYYLKSDGIMATGWVNDNGTWYYLNASGAMKTGWVNDNGTWYYLNVSGAMLAGTTVDGYTLGSDGAWIG